MPANAGAFMPLCGWRPLRRMVRALCRVVAPARPLVPGGDPCALCRVVTRAETKKCSLLPLAAVKGCTNPGRATSETGCATKHRHFAHTAGADHTATPRTPHSAHGANTADRVHERGSKLAFAPRCGHSFNEVSLANEKYDDHRNRGDHRRRYNHFPVPLTAEPKLIQQRL